MHVERDPESELSRRLRLDRVPPAGVELDIDAGDAERAALARRFAVLGVPDLRARVALRSEGGGHWRVEGHLAATVVQECGVTLDPVEQRIDEPFALRFSRDAEALDHETGDLIVDADAPEPLEGDWIDLGAIVADQLGLAIDPFPRKPGVSLSDILPQGATPAAAGGPFAALAALKRGRKDAD